MNTPIIDPMIFYWLQVLDTLSKVIGLLLVLGLAAVLFLTIAAFVENDLGSNSEYRDGYIKKCFSKRDMYISILKKVAVALIIPILFEIFVPSKSTMIQMMVAKEVTAENIQTSKKFVIDTIVEVKNALDEKKK